MRATTPATDITLLTPAADLSITKADGQTAAVAGSSRGLHDRRGQRRAVERDRSHHHRSAPDRCARLDMVIHGDQGSACGSPSGAGALATTADIAPSGSVTYTVSVRIDPSAQGSFSNTATVEMATGGTDTDASNNSATDTDQLRAEGTLTLTKTHTTNPVVAGAAIQYVLVAGNAGPSTARGVRVLDPLPPDLVGATWTCTRRPVPRASRDRSGRRRRRRRPATWCECDDHRRRNSRPGRGRDAEQRRNARHPE